MLLVSEDLKERQLARDLLVVLSCVVALLPRALENLPQEGAVASQLEAPASNVLPRVAWLGVGRCSFDLCPQAGACRRAVPPMYAVASLNECPSRTCRAELIDFQ
jgi:hypothetical protein